MSQTIASVFLILLSQVLPNIGVSLPNEALQTTISTILTIGAAIWIYVRRYQAGDVTKFGFKK